MKRFLAVLLAAVLVCSIVATALAVCSHDYILDGPPHSWVERVPYWTGCANNSYVHAHERFYKIAEWPQRCRKCKEPYTKVIKTLLRETCPCAN